MNLISPVSSAVSGNSLLGSNRPSRGIIGSEEIAARLTYAALIPAMRDAFVAMSLDEARSFPRRVDEIRPGQSVGLMTALSLQLNVICLKSVVVTKTDGHSPEKSGSQPGATSHCGTVQLFELSTGRPLGVFDAEAITALRTAATSAFATGVLSRQNSSILGIVGVGRQAVEHMKALLPVRAFSRVVVFGRKRDEAIRFKSDVEDCYDLPCDLAATPAEVLREADVINFVTSSRNPIADIRDAKPGSHINAVGACRPGFRELILRDLECLQIYLDSMSHIMEEADEVRLPLEAGILTRQCVRGPISDHLKQLESEQRDPNAVTLFKSVGLGIQDLYAASLFLANSGTGS
ncbi:MAG: hypothetical protein NTV34_05205 [Proteobacteria bacterium]|nr:hypothetical protein [Pseudomonadota bacterium]